jgi:alkanesulfonate monooxygenase SsuD/methylene tetrahydromethanopterin reductase-like flavin-dependent oxidoreductase (luciferase family)
VSQLRISFKTSPQRVDWSTLDETWALAGELPVLEGAWLNDHLMDLGDPREGGSLEALTLAATLAHRVPGKWVGHGVLSNTFRHPAMLAKAATVLDHATGGHFILGLGAGWHEDEHRSFGLPLPPLKERIDRLESAVEVLRALFSDEARTPPGVSRPDPFYPLDGATNEPPTVASGGPPIYLGGQGPRGIALAARAADGWILPGLNAGDAVYMAEKRDALLRELERVGRDPSGFGFAGQVLIGRTADDRERALAQALGLVDIGATEVVLGIVGSSGPTGLQAVVDEVAIPIREAIG